MNLTIEMTEDVARAVRLPEGEAAERLRRELAIRLYDKSLLSFGKARSLAEMTYWEFHELLGKEGVQRHYDIEEFEEDMKTLEKLR
jgi:predicted HTH domain antitoxin